MLSELFGKAGRLCQPARQGELKCPLIVRPTSEDVITGHLFQVLKVLNPRWWVPDLLNYALGAPRFRRQVYRGFRIEPWKNRPPYPRELLPWREGSTQVEVTLSWENPPTTVFIEMKYTADVAPRTAADDGSSGYPSDQLIRNIRVGLLETGWFRRKELFGCEQRDFAMVLISPEKGHRLIREYRCPQRLREAIPHSELIPQLPETPFVGELGFGDLLGFLGRQQGCFSRPEQRLIDDLCSYLQMKREQLTAGKPNDDSQQLELSERPNEKETGT